jgi:hypothetical protein
MTPRIRRLALTAHVIFSVGWLGAVAGFLVLSIAGLTSRDAEVVRSAYLAMDLIGRLVIVPMSLAALATGLLQALATEWGVFLHYWVLAKFIMTMFATFLLLLHQYTAVAGAARRAVAAAPGTLPDVGRLGTQLIVDSGLALLVLVVITTLSVYKPWGLTGYGRRKLQERFPDSRKAVAVGGLPLGAKVVLAGMGAIALGFVVLHLTGHGFGGHGH